MLIQCPISDPPLLGATYEARMQGPDQGLTTAWLAGIIKRRESPDVATQATAGELPLLPFRGGVDRAIKTKTKTGSLLYVAMWQGLRNEDLSIDTTSEPVMTCSRTGVSVTYTLDIEKLWPPVPEAEEESA